MPPDPKRVKALFFDLLDRDDPADRLAFLDRECGQDIELRQRLETLLAAHDAPAAGLEQPVEVGTDHDPDRTTDTPNSPEAGAQTASLRPANPSPGPMIGSVIAGRYKIRQEIGEGGMGSVYLAEQKQPIKRMVALKLIKPGMDSRTVLARFESERQALALMDHPHIAKVLDAGTTELGRPYFVMELVKGIPLTDYCDQHQLGLSERLALFRQICSAVQHAHQKGIIHRDLKPTNILVESHDGKPVPKVIDFGLAKATSGMQLSEHSLFTAFGSVTGTPLYMAPEQATFNALDVDTRADIYALGVILYELLTGSTPIQRDIMKRAALDEMLRVIREVEPPTPSSRISTSEGLPSIAASRHVEPGRLSRLVRGDLDWIVMKALAKERDRRYDSAIGMANDVERYLNHEPVSAGPPTAAYRMRKFVRRHRGQVIAAALVLLVLVGGVVGTTLGLIEARRQEQRARVQERIAQEAAEQERLARQAEADQRREAVAQRDQAEKRLTQIEKANEILGSIFKDLNPRNAEKDGKPLTALLGERLDQATAQIEGEAIGDPITVAWMQMTLGESQLGLGYPEKAIVLLSKSRETFTAKLGSDHPATLASMNNLALGYQAAGRLDHALPLFEQTLALVKAKLGTDHLYTLVSMNCLAEGYRAAGQLDRALPLQEQTLTLMKAKLGVDHPDTLNSMNNLALGYQAAGRLDRALPLFEQALTLRKAKLGADHPDTLISMNNLARGYQDAGRLDRALPLFEQTLTLVKAKLGDDHPDTLTSMNNLARGYQDAGRLDRALPLFEQTLTLVKAKLGADHPNTLISITNLASGYQADGRLDRALPLYEQTLALQKAKLGADHPDTLISMNNLARGYQDAGRLDRALPLFEQTLTLLKAKLGDDHPTTLTSMNNLARGYQDANQLDRALPLFEQTLALQKAKLGVDHPDTLTSMNNLAGGYQGVNQLDRALPLFEQTLMLRKARLGADHPNTLASMNNLALCYRAANQLDRALPLFEQTLMLRKEKLGADHPGTLTSMNNLATGYQAAGRLDRALPLYEQTLELQKAKLGADHPDTLMSMNNLATGYQAAGRLDRALPLYEQTLILRKAKLGDDHLDTLVSMNNLAEGYRAAGRLDRALPLFEQTLTLRKEKLGADHPDILTRTHNLAVVYWQAKKLDRSVPLLEEVLKRQIARLGPDHPDTWLTRANLGVNYKDAGRLDEALPLLEQAAVAGRRLPLIRFVRPKLIEGYLEAGRSEQAVALARETLEESRATLPANSPQLAGLMAQTGLTLMQAKAWADAEPILREALTIREAKEPDDWKAFNTRSVLGGALLGQKKYTEAEPLLRAGYEGMKARADKIPPAGQTRPGEALDRLIELAEATGKPDEAKAWREEKAKLAGPPSEEKKP